MIIENMLSTINDSDSEGATKTSIMYKSFLSYAQLKEYLSLLLEKGLINKVPKQIKSHGNEKFVYKITGKGLDIAADIESVHNILQKQLDVMLRVGNIGRFMAMDLIDRISTIGSTLSSNLDRMTEQERSKYKQFLMTELNKLDEQEKNKEIVSVE